MIRNLVLLAGLSLLALTYTYYADQGSALSSAPDKVVDEGSQAEMQAPDFSITAIDGKTYALHDFRGRPVILNFWATWCAPCVIEFPQMLDLAKAQPDMVFIFLSQDENKSDIDRFVKKYGQTLPQKNVIIALDESKSIARDVYQTYKLPETYLIDKDGGIRDKIIGAVDWTKPKTTSKVEALLLR